jgi:hypothetical protein
MSGWQPQQDPGQQRSATPPYQGQQPDPWGASTGYGPQQPAAQRPPVRAGDPRGGMPQQYQAPRQPVQRRATGLTAAGAFWYIVQCIAFGAGYFAKVPAKKALQDFGMAQMTAAEQFWYVLMCIGFGAGYFAKLPVAKALSEMQRR